MRPSHHRRLPNTVVGVIAVVVVLIGSVLAFTKQLPWSDGYEVKAVFTTAQNIRTASPVRIAGVNVGEVTEVRPLESGDEELAAALGAEEARAAAASETQGQQAAVVTMRIEDAGRPIKEDATFQLRPRLFLEGNLFVDAKPGSPAAPEAPDGYTFPLDQTAVSVQLDQVLTTLQSNVRQDLQTFLDEFGAALIDHGGAEGFQELYRTSPGSYRYTAEVNEALLGEEPHDLSGFIRNFDRVARGLARNEEQLKGLVTNFRIFAGSFAAESAALERAIRTLPGVLRAARPAFANLNASFPPLRAFAREALPGVRSSAPTLDAATPFIRQVRKLASRRELRGLTKDLRPAIPRLAKLNRRTLPFLDQSRALSSCFNEVTIPWGNTTVPDPDFPPTGPLYKETGYGLVGLNGESRSGDGNGQLFRVQQGGGANTVESDGGFFGLTDLPIEGVNPPVESAAKTPFVLRSGRDAADIPCENQEPPNLETGGPGPPPIQTSADADLSSPVAELAFEKAGFAVDQLEAQVLRGLGRDAEARELQRAASRRQRRFEQSKQQRFERLIGEGGGSK